MNHARSRRDSALGILLSLSAAGVAFGFTPLRFPSSDDIESGRIAAWRDSTVLVASASETDLYQPLSLSFTIDDQFMASEPEEVASAAAGAVRSALARWQVCAAGALAFIEAPWSAVPNAGDAPPASWEGPSIPEWQTGEFPGTLPGWGANIDVFSRPTGFTITSRGQEFEMRSGNLGFAIVNVSGTTEIVSVDVYLNEDFNWAATADQSGFDILTVVMHEIGHGLGLDHPDEATDNGSLNLTPLTFEPGEAEPGSSLMCSQYHGRRERPTVDEVGGMAMLYKGHSPLDLVGNGLIDSADLGRLLTAWGDSYTALGDLDYNGAIDGADLGVLLAYWGPLPGLAGQP